MKIHNQEFSSKKAAKTFISSMRDQYPDHIRIPEPDHSFLISLLSMHPDAALKIGPGISFFSVDTEKTFKTRHFVVHRVDYSHTDFSFVSCLDGSNKRRATIEAFRREIASQIIDFRDRQFETSTEVRCPVTNTILQKNTCHIDHVAPQTFKNLVNEWLLSKNLSLENIKLTLPADNQIIYLMADLEHRQSWFDFHASHCVLRIVSPEANHGGNV